MTVFFFVLKGWLSEKATKFEKNLRRTFDKSQRTCQKVDEDF